MFLREITHTVNAFNDMAEIKKLKKRKKKELKKIFLKFFFENFF